MANSRRTALVTGGAKRVGRAIVQRLARAGFDVLFTYHSSGKDAGSLAAEVQGLGVATQCLQVDLQADDSVEQTTTFVKSCTNRLDLLVNNASLYLPDDETARAALSRRMQRIHVEVPMGLALRLAPLLRAARGHVINMIDILAEKPMPSHSIYCASKAALLNSTLSLARQLAPEVTVNGISPGVVEWPETMPLDQREAYLARVPLRRAGTPQDVANLVHFLATEGAYITGQNLRLDGGRSIA